MPQPKKTTTQHKLLGNYRPSRHQQRPADHGAIGPAPEHLEDDLRHVWGELADALPYGIGTASDRISFELASRLVLKMRAGKLNAAECTQLINLLAGFGLTPMGRQRLDPEPPPPDPSAPLTGLARFRKPSALDKYR